MTVSEYHLVAVCKSKCVLYMLPPPESAAELTCQQAADRLGVSLEFVLQRIDDGSLRSRNAGGDLRIASGDLVEFQQRLDGRRRAALDELATQAQELDMVY